MVIKKLVPALRRRRVGPRSDSVRASFAVSAVLLCISASPSLAQAIGDSGAGPGPIEETWRYLVDMFRMILGL